MLLKQETANNFVKVISGCQALCVFINTDVQSAPQDTTSPVVWQFCTDDLKGMAGTHELLGRLNLYL